MSIKDESAVAQAEAGANSKKPGWIKDNIDDINSFIRNANNLNVLLAALVAYFYRAIWLDGNEMCLRFFLFFVIGASFIFIALIYWRTICNFWDILSHNRNDYNVTFPQKCYVILFMILITIVPIVSFVILFNGILKV